MVGGRLGVGVSSSSPDVLGVGEVIIASSGRERSERGCNLVDYHQAVFRKAVYRKAPLPCPDALHRPTAAFSPSAGYDKAASTHPTAVPTPVFFRANQTASSPFGQN